MTDRCRYCPIPPGEPCLALPPTCERAADPEFAAAFRRRQEQTAAARAAALTAAYPPDSNSPVPIGRCCG
jgi:hypothetical protein